MRPDPQTPATILGRVLLAWSIAAGCRSAPSVSPHAASPGASAATPAIAAGSRAVVRQGAAVYFDAERTRRWSLPPTMPGGGLAVVVHAQREGVLELQLDTASACAPATTRDFRLRLFAAREDLARIVTRPLELALADGRRVHVRAGLVAPTDGPIVLTHERRTIGVPVPADAVGETAPALAAADGDACATLDTPTGSQPLAIVDQASDALAAARLAAGPGAKVLVAAGARVYSRDGHEQGIVAREHAFDTPMAVAGARTCMALPIAVGDELPLCFDAADLRNPPPPVAVSPTGRRIVGRLRQPKPSVSGGLERDIVRRIIRAHLNEVRHCYNQALALDSSVVGKVAVRFTIDADGAVVDASIASASAGTEAVAECAAIAVRRWLFPKPVGGVSVVVTQAFELQGI